MNHLKGLVVLLLPIGAWADVVAPLESVENFVNIRMNADSTSEVVGRLNRGEFLPLISTNEAWLEVDISGGATGFVSADWVVVHADIPNIDLVSADNVPQLRGEAVEEATDNREPSSTDVNADIVAENAEAFSVATAADELSDVAVELDEVADEENVRSEIGAAAAIVGSESDEAVDNDLAEEMTSKVEEGAEIVIETDTGVKVVDEELNAISPVIEDVAGEFESLDASVPGETVGLQGLTGLQGPKGDPGPPGPPGAATIEGSVGFLARFSAPTVGVSSQIYDDGNNIGIGTTTPVQRLEVNGNIQIHEQNSSVAGLMITQSDGETGYIMHNRASTLTIGAGSIDRVTIDGDGNVGFGVSRPAHPIEMASGAHVTAGGVWTNSSSRSRKENISTLTAEDAVAALSKLEPVQYNYKNDQVERYVGFIAEDVPDLVATEDRNGLSAMDIVAVLTKVVQEQQMKIEALEARLEQR